MISHESSRPTLAAVIANYNYERFLSGAVSSLLDQSVAFTEIIVVDDGSTDGSLAVLGSFGDRITVVAQENTGQLGAAYAGIAVATSDYVYVLDSDDLASPDLVETVLPHLAASPVKVQFQVHSMDEHGVPIDSIFPSFAEGYGSAQMIADNDRLGFYVCPPTSGNIFRTDYLRALVPSGLNEREAYDGVPAQLAPYFGESVSLNVPLARYRVHGSSDSQWGKPTPELLRGELARFDSRWEEATRVLRDFGTLADAPSRSAYLLERHLMISVLEGRRASIRTAVSYVRRTARSGLSRSQRIAFSGWALALPLLPRATATGMVVSRRSSTKRGRLLTAVARLARTSSA